MSPTFSRPEMNRQKDRHTARLREKQYVFGGGVGAGSTEL